jgi:hypothetical protein
MNIAQNNIPTSPPSNPVTGSYYFDTNESAILVWVGNNWQKTYMSGEKHIDRISVNQYSCPNILSAIIDNKIKQIGLCSIKKSRKFDRVLYTVDDETELNIFTVYFNEVIK